MKIDENRCDVAHCILPANGLPDTAATLRTIDLERGIIAKRPPLAPPAPGPNLSID